MCPPTVPPYLATLRNIGRQVVTYCPQQLTFNSHSYNSSYCFSTWIFHLPTWIIAMFNIGVLEVKSPSKGPGPQPTLVPKEGKENKMQPI